MNIIKSQELDIGDDIGNDIVNDKDIRVYNMIKAIIVKDNDAVNEMIKVFQEKYHFQKYIEVVNLEENDDFKQFLNVTIFYYGKHTLPD